MQLSVHPTPPIFQPILDRIAHTQCIEAAYFYISLCAYVFGTQVSCAKTDELIEAAVWVNQRNIVLDGGPDQTIGRKALLRGICAGQL